MHEAWGLSHSRCTASLVMVDYPCNESRLMSVRPRPPPQHTHTHTQLVAREINVLCHNGTFVVVMDIPCSAWPLKPHLYSVCYVKFIKHLIYDLIFYVSTVCSLLLVFWLPGARLHRDISMYSLMHTQDKYTHTHPQTHTHTRTHTHAHTLALFIFENSICLPFLCQIIAYEYVSHY